MPCPAPEKYDFDTGKILGQPWITIFLDRVAQAWRDTPRTTIRPMYDLRDTNDHMLPQNSQGNEVWDFPIERLASHRFDDHGQIKYKIEYVRHPLPKDHECGLPAYIQRPIIYQMYNQQHGIVIDEPWLETDEAEEQDVVMTDATDAIEEEADDEEDDDNDTDDDDSDEDYIP